MIDFHTHILPGVDDGSASVEESLELLRLEAEQGISQVVLTPHFYPRYDDPDSFLRRRDRAESALRRSLEGHDGFPEVTVGAEVHFFRGISESEHLNRLTFSEKGCILIEMPPAPWQDSMYRELERIHTHRGLTPVIAHVDRYISPFRTHGIPRALEELPVLVQANASFFLNRSTSSMAMKLLREGRIHLLGSDCHNLTTRRPNLGPAMDRIRGKLGPGALRKVRSCGEALLTPSEQKYFETEV